MLVQLTYRSSCVRHPWPIVVPALPLSLLFTLTLYIAVITGHLHWHVLLLSLRISHFHLCETGQSNSSFFTFRQTGNENSSWRLPFLSSFATRVESYFENSSCTTISWVPVEFSINRLGRTGWQWLACATCTSIFPVHGPEEIEISENSLEFQMPCRWMSQWCCLFHPFFLKIENDLRPSFVYQLCWQ